MILYVYVSGALELNLNLNMSYLFFWADEGRRERSSSKPPGESEAEKRDSPGPGEDVGRRGDQDEKKPKGKKKKKPQQQEACETCEFLASRDPAELRILFFNGHPVLSPPIKYKSVCCVCGHLNIIDLVGPHGMYSHATQNDIHKKIFIFDSF
jgi:hypothetical protein